jgi:hypothetical protein
VSSEPLVTRLESDVRDLLSVGHVGLYEFRWALRGFDLALDEETCARVSLSVLDRLREGGFGLGWFVWPELEPRAEENRPTNQLGGDIWADPRKGEPYLALIGS